MDMVDSSDPAAMALVQAIRTGNMTALEWALAERPGLAAARIRLGEGRSATALHVATDWPGYFPGGPAVVRALIEAGADPDARAEGGEFAETPLHWAASSDDSDVAEALLDGGADMKADGASIGGGTALDNAIGYGCWHVARLLVSRGAPVAKLWHAAALGMMPRVAEFLARDPGPSPSQISEAFWQACHGGQRRAAEYLLARGADINTVPGYARRTPLGIAPGPDTRRDALVTWLREQGAAAAAD
jgi:ankyrin repeat protein